MCVHAALKNAEQQQAWKVLENTMLKSFKKSKKHLKGPLELVYFRVISQFKNIYILSCQNIYLGRSHKTLFHTYYCYLSHGLQTDSTSIPCKLLCAISFALLTYILRFHFNGLKASNLDQCDSFQYKISWLLLSCHELSLN